MPDPRRLAEKFTDRLVRTGEPWIDKQPAALGDYQGVVQVPGTQNQVYARTNNGQVVKVFNNVAPNINDWRVYIGRDKQQPTLHKVLDVRWMYNISRTFTYIAFHHTQHEYPHPDTVWVRRDQFMPLLVLPAGGLTVQLYGDIIFGAGMESPIRVENELIDLSSYASSGGAYYLLIEIDQDGLPNIIQGDTYGSLLLLREDAPLPVPTPGNFPVAAIEIYEGQTAIRRDSTQRNIIDLRMFTSDVTAVALDNLSDVTITDPVTNEVLTYNGTVWVNAEPTGGGGGGGGTPWVYDNLTSQIPAASDDYTLSGTPTSDVLVFWNSTFQTDFTVVGTTLSLNFSPIAGDVLVAIYDISGTFVEPAASPALRIYMNQNFTM